MPQLLQTIPLNPPLKRATYYFDTTSNPFGFAHQQVGFGLEEPADPLSSIVLGVVEDSVSI